MSVPPKNRQRGQSLRSYSCRFGHPEILCCWFECKPSLVDCAPVYFHGTRRVKPGGLLGNLPACPCVQVRLQPNVVEVDNDLMLIVLFVCDGLVGCLVLYIYVLPVFGCGVRDSEALPPISLRHANQTTASSTS